MKVRNLFGITCVWLIICALSGCNEEKEFAVDETIYLNYGPLNLFYGDKIQLTANPGSSNYEWSSEDNAVATITSTGEIEAVGVGTTNIVVSNGNIQKELSVTVTIPKADKVTGRAGFDRAAVELDIRSNRIKTVKIIRLDTEEVFNFDVNYQMGVIIAYYESLAEAKYSFRVVCIDKYGMESIPTDIDVRVYGDNFRSKATIRQFKAATVFGNGLAIGWGENPVGSLVDVRFVNKEGKPLTKLSNAPGATSHIPDYQAYPLVDFSYRTGYIPEKGAIDTFYTAPVNISAENVNDKRTFLTKDAPAIVKACDFDLGGEGVSFHDSNKAHEGGNVEYRKGLGDYYSEGVDVEENLNLGYVDNDEWLIYTVDVIDAGNYAIDFHLSVNGDGAKCHVEADGVASANYDLENNNNWGDWRYYCEKNNITPPSFYLAPGKHKIKFYVNSGKFNFNGLRFTWQDMP